MIHSNNAMLIIDFICIVVQYATAYNNSHLAESLHTEMGNIPYFPNMKMSQQSTSQKVSENKKWKQ